MNLIARRKLTAEPAKYLAMLGGVRSTARLVSLFGLDPISSREAPDEIEMRVGKMDPPTVKLVVR